MTFVTKIKIPEDVAKELSDLINKKTVRLEVAASCIKDDEAYAIAESKLIQVTERMEFLKDVITNQFIPLEYKSEEYTWNYNGYLIDKDEISIYKN